MLYAPEGATGIEGGGGRGGGGDECLESRATEF
jgi:hypothetical protein